MQQQHLKLREIIWEITGECKNNCSYCGSKDARCSKTENSTILKIAEQISLYPPKEITISGGDPLLVDFAIHKEIIEKFEGVGITSKILINPKSLSDKSADILKLYNWIGISINTKEELEISRKYINENVDIRNITVVTNFNIQNLFCFDLVESFVKEYNFAWTIQFTVYKNPNPMALYSEENEQAFEFFKEKYFKSNAKIILSDNIVKSVPCGAGLCSVGITFDGYVVPCLSMRSWENSDFQYRYFNIFEKTLIDIWENGFKDLRFCEFKCCKDQCENKNIPQKAEPVSFEITTKKGIDAQEEIKKFLEQGKEKDKYPNWPHPQPITLPDGTGSPDFPQIIMYGVTSDPWFNRD